MTNEKQKKVKPNKGIIIAICLASFVLVVLFVWLFASSRFTGVANGGIVMVVRYEGGLCPDNSMCSSEYKLYENGVFDGHDRASSQEISELQRVIDQTDFLQYDFDKNAVCQSYMDGQDLVLQFPDKYENQSFRPCSLHIPAHDTSIQYIEDFIESHSKD
ncbi:hypothetical protein BGO18_03830 [Candidatus Saccharibacteria bacterium 47-87]|nr:hypothetical protein [Candidatus Saccharibacteria bacterium]OJU97267.1 MAG: hypothetical protein BGO18_03830 [Candidatus Saccharibacteria bacterium 47-87]